MKLLSPLVLAAVVALTGCAATVSRGSPDRAGVQVPAASAKHVALSVVGSSSAVTGSSDWAEFRQLWYGAVGGAAAGAGMQFAVQDGAPHTESRPGTLIVIRVKDYHYVSSGARIGLGVFTGNAYVNADVEYRDLQNERLFGQQNFNTSSSAWQGVFSAMTNDQVQALGREVISEIKPN